MNRTSPRRQHGLSLVELMVAIVLAVLLIGGVMQIFLASRQTYSTNSALSRVQENGRFAMEFLGYDVRNAGYKGECLGTPNNLLNESGTGYHADLFDMSTAIKGWENASPTWVTNRRAGTDVILLKHAAGVSGVTATGNTPANSNTISVNNASSLPNNTIVIVSDALGCDTFQTRNNQNATTLSRGNVGTPGNKNPGSHDFSHAYDSSMEILKLRSAIYYIGPGASGLPALRRISFDTGVADNQELVEGIQDMQILYGLADLDQQVTQYVQADSVTNWDNVAAVRIELLAVSPDTNVVAEDQVVSFNGSDVTIGNRRLAQPFTTTLGVRNRLP